MAKEIQLYPRPDVIPPITHPSGGGQYQPREYEYLMDEKYILLRREAFERLAEYSLTLPGMRYQGKCWKRQSPRSDKWYFHFCTDVPNEPNYVDIHCREILLID